jgi:hypothetical protein
VFKAKMQQGGSVIDVALKELLIKDEGDIIYDFQHEITIMRYIPISWMSTKISHQQIES